MPDYHFWKTLRRPFFALAPMADVTDAAFRRIIAKYSAHDTQKGGPDIFWTEFVSCDGLESAGRDVLLRDLAYTEAERPIVAQVFGSEPRNFESVARLIRSLGFDGLDINMGCPVRTIQKQCAGAFLIQEPMLARDIILAAKEGAGDMPVSVKTRSGYNERELDRWIPVLLDSGIAALTLHARTKKEMSRVPACWYDVKHVVEMAQGTDTVIIGNGDVASLADGYRRVEETGADGIMIGRAVFGNPWLFRDATCPIHQRHISAEPVAQQKEGCKCVTYTQKLSVMLEHTGLFEELLGDHKHFSVMKKHYKAYVNGFIGAKELRVRLMEAQSYREVRDITESFLAGNPFTACV